MGNVNMEASQINYRGGATKMSVEEALKNTSGELDTLKRGLNNLVKMTIITTTTDADGDGQFSLPAGGSYLVGTKPVRDDDYYNAWWGIIIAASNSSNYGFKAVDDRLNPLAHQPVMFRIFYV